MLLQQLDDRVLGVGARLHILHHLLEPANDRVVPLPGKLFAQMGLEVF